MFMAFKSVGEYLMTLKVSQISHKRLSVGIDSLVLQDSDNTIVSTVGLTRQLRRAKRVLTYSLAT
jgi:hypothetical protein